MSTALGDLVVIDRSNCIAGEYCARLMSDFGAEVWLVEGEGGSATRSIGPFDKSGLSLTHLHLNIGKRAGEPGRIPDVFICAADEELSDLRERAPKPILVQITPFGNDGPMAGWAGPEIVLQASSGMMNSNGIRGREPLYGIGNRASYAAGLAAYIQLLASLPVRAKSGRSDIIRIDAAETASAMCFPYVLQAIYNGTDRRRGDQDIPVGMVKCQGAWVCLWVYSNKFERLCRSLGLEYCLSDPRFAQTTARSKNWSAFFRLVQKRVRSRDPDDWVGELQGMAIIASRAYRPSELRQSRHLKARGYWRSVRIEGQDYVLPGPVFRMSGTPARELVGDGHAST